MLTVAVKGSAALQFGFVNYCFPRAGTDRRHDCSEKG